MALLQVGYLDAYLVPDVYSDVEPVVSGAYLAGYLALLPDVYWVLFLFLYLALLKVAW
jgi:hypothetical protein